MAQDSAKNWKKFGKEDPLNHYPSQKLFDLFSRYSKTVHVEFTNHGGHLGAFYLLRKDADPNR